MKKKQERQSNFELLRILCTIAIISDHFVGQSGIADGSFFTTAAVSLSRVSCSVFVILSAWFSAESAFHSKQLFHIWLTAFFWQVGISFVLWLRGSVPASVFRSALFPLEESGLWFASYFSVLLLFSPLLKALVRREKRLTEWILLVLAVLMVGYSTLSGSLGFFASEIWPLIFVYVLTLYLRLYLPEPPRPGTAAIVFGLSWAALTGLRFFAARRGLPLLASYGELYRARLQTLPNLLLAFSLFFAFRGVRIPQSRWINRVASCSLGVYAIHQTPLWYPLLWEKVFFAPVHAALLQGGMRKLYVVAAVLTVEAAGTILELLRSGLMGLLIEKRSWFLRFCDRLDRFVENRESVTL